VNSRGVEDVGALIARLKRGLQQAVVEFPDCGP
jgi:hypothetical protein